MGQEWCNCGYHACTVARATGSKRSMQQHLPDITGLTKILGTTLVRTDMLQTVTYCSSSQGEGNLHRLGFVDDHISPRDRRR